MKIKLSSSHVIALSTTLLNNITMKFIVNVDLQITLYAHETVVKLTIFQRYIRRIIVIDINKVNQTGHQIQDAVKVTKESWPQYLMTSLSKHIRNTCLPKVTTVCLMPVRLFKFRYSSYCRYGVHLTSLSTTLAARCFRQVNKAVWMLPNCQ